MRAYDIPNALIRLRKEQGKSQVLVARAAGIGQDHLSHIENGKKAPSLETLQKILDALGVESFCDFFALAEKIAAKTKLSVEILDEELIKRLKSDKKLLKQILAKIVMETPD